MKYNCNATFQPLRLVKIRKMNTIRIKVESFVYSDNILGSSMDTCPHSLSTGTETYRQQSREGWTPNVHQNQLFQKKRLINAVVENMYYIHKHKLFAVLALQHYIFSFLYVSAGSFPVKTCRLQYCLRTVYHDDIRGVPCLSISLQLYVCANVFQL